LFQAWGKYVDDLPDIKEAKNREEALHCLNELITNALQHIPDVIKYLSRIRNPTVFQFCAIPQVRICTDEQRIKASTQCMMQHGADLRTKTFYYLFNRGFICLLE